MNMLPHQMSIWTDRNADLTQSFFEKEERWIRLGRKKDTEQAPPCRPRSPVGETDVSADEAPCLIHYEGYYSFHPLSVSFLQPALNL